MNGYAYAGNSPVTSSDPSGSYVNLTGCPDGECSTYLRSEQKLVPIIDTLPWDPDGKLHVRSENRTYKYYADRNGNLVAAMQCPQGYTPNCMPQKFIMGPVTPCESGNNPSVPCFKGPDGRTYDTDGTPACTQGPCNYGNFSQNGGGAPGVSPVQQRTCLPPPPAPPMISNPRPPVMGGDPDEFVPPEKEDDCASFWGCVAVHLDAASLALGYAGVICEACDVLSTGFAMASAAAYVLDGNNEAATLEAEVGVVSLVGGRFFADSTVLMMEDERITSEAVREIGGMWAGTAGGYESGFGFECAATQGEEGCYEMGFMDKPEESSD